MIIGSGLSGLRMGMGDPEIDCERFYWGCGGIGGWVWNWVWNGLVNNDHKLIVFHKCG